MVTGLVLWLVLLLALQLNDSAAPPVIDAGSVARLQPALRIDFDSLPPAVGEIANGRFFINDAGTRLAVVNRDNAIVALTDTGEVVGMCAVTGADGLPATFIEGMFGTDDSVIVSVYTDGPLSYYISRCDAATGAQTVWPVAVALAALWLDGDTIYAADVGGSVIRIAPDGDLTTYTVPSPETDSETLIRIGRITPPLAVTITEDNRVKRWDLQTGAMTAVAQVESGPPIYGHLTPDGRYLVWRDPPSTALHVLDFATGVDRTVAALNGLYIPFVFIGLKGDILIGVQPDADPVVVAWDVATGTRTDLGPFRTCSRPPDMARLSADGTALVIGCDTGLEIWRLEESKSG
jgi:hypothetical protein